MQLNRVQHLVFWWLLFLGLLLPVFYIFYQAFQNSLGAEPAKALVEYLGEVAFIILLVTLALTPIARFKFVPRLVRYRRMIGLYAFFYAFIHVASYGLFLVDWQNFVEDLYQRPYVMVGAVAFLILAVLAITSPKAMLIKLGKRWKSLHRTVYVAAICTLIHVLWQTRSDYAEALWFGTVLAVLLAFRYQYFQKLASNLVGKSPN